MVETNGNVDVDSRWLTLEQIICDSTLNDSTVFNVDVLLDCLISVYDSYSKSSIKTDKSINLFREHGKNGMKIFKFHQMKKKNSFFVFSSIIHFIDKTISFKHK